MLQSKTWYESPKALQPKLQSTREVIHKVCSAIAKKSNPEEDDLSAITRLYEELIANRRHVKVEEHYEIGWKVDETLEALL